jgi:hypothetical protein
MSALGHKQTLKRAGAMSALPPKADTVELDRNVRFVPEADSCTAAKSIPIDLHVGFEPAA